MIDPVVAQAEVARAEGALAESQSRYENLLKGKRPGGEGRHAPRSAARPRPRWPMAEIEYQRQSELLAKGVGTRKDYDNAESQMRQLRMRQNSLAAQEKVERRSPRGPTRSPPPRRWSTRTRPTSTRRGSGSTT